MGFLSRTNAGARSPTQKTIEDYGDQWVRYPDHDGYYGSLELLRDIVGPLLSLQDVTGSRVAEIGSGTGRIVKMLMEAGAAHVLALEPSKAFGVLERNTHQYEGRVQLLRARGDEIPSGLELDFVFAIGVLHHIPDPAPVVEAVFRALRPGGRIVIWVYGLEGNELYLAFVRPLRKITTRLPHILLTGLCWSLCLALDVYILLARVLPVPMRGYVRGPLAKVTRSTRHLVIYDQLKPAYAKYYKENEVIALLRAGGFEGVSLYHRHWNSWTATARKPDPGGGVGRDKT
ncbi:MAG: class I SAM-dependent methyltransferase [Anaerolineae bacterium]